MVGKISIIFLISFWVTVTAKSQYFDVILDRFELLENDKEYSEWNVRVRKFNTTTRALFGTINVLKPVGNDFSAEAVFYKKQGNEYRLTPYRIQKAPFCNAFAEDPYIYKDVVKKSDFPPDLKTNCPLPVKNYTLDGVLIPLDAAPQNAFQSNDYMGEVKITKGMTIFAKLRVYVTIINIE